MAGENLPLVGKPLGHRRHRTTAGYAHPADEHLVEAAEKVGNIIARAIGHQRTNALRFEVSAPPVAELISKDQ